MSAYRDWSLSDALSDVVKHVAPQDTDSGPPGSPQMTDSLSGSLFQISGKSVPMVVRTLVRK